MRGLFLLCWLATATGATDNAAELRRQYNQVAASIDTLVRLYGGERLEELSARQGKPSPLPAGQKLVLIFWADDEAQLYLNGQPIGSTRLTPTRIEIPAMYLRDENVLSAHCWDTDRVESGFMAGLYLQDARTRLRRVLVTDEENWWVGGERAKVRFYSHTVPDIPGAEVIWGAGLFGEFQIEAAFNAGQLNRAAQSRPLASRPPGASREPMEAHLVASRLVQLQRERDELAQGLERRRSPVHDVRYQGYIKGRLAFTLGKAGALAEVQSVSTAQQLAAWAAALPAQQRDLVFHERRELKGVRHATSARSFMGGRGAAGERRSDYVPPAERGPIYGEGKPATAGGAAGLPYVAVGGRTRWDLWLAAAGLLLYIGAAGQRWWRLFRAKVWIS